MKRKTILKVWHEERTYWRMVTLRKNGEADCRVGIMRNWKERRMRRRGRIITPRIRINNINNTSRRATTESRLIIDATPCVHLHLRRIAHPPFTHYPLLFKHFILTMRQRTKNDRPPVSRLAIDRVTLRLNLTFLDLPLSIVPISSLRPNESTRVISFPAPPKKSTSPRPYVSLLSHSLLQLFPQYIILPMILKRMLKRVFLICFISRRNSSISKWPASRSRVSFGVKCTAT